MLNLIFSFIFHFSLASPIHSAATESARDLQQEYNQYALDNATERAKNPAQQYAYWQNIGAFDKPLEDRIIGLTPEVAKLTQAYMDLFFSFQQSEGQPLPEIVDLDENLERDLKLAIGSMPASVHVALEKYLGAIVIVRNMRVNGLAALLLDDKNNKQLGGISILNIDTLDNKVNDWWTTKESSPYKGNKLKGALSLEAKIDQRPKFNDRVRSLQLVLLHEFGHILAYGNGVFPRWDIPLEKPWQVNDYPYIDFSWMLYKNQEILNYEQLFHFQKYFRKLAYFKDENSRKLDNQDMFGVLQSLQKMEFVTPYSTTDSHEDFAELFAFVVMTKYLNFQPQLIIKNADGQVILNHDIDHVLSSERMSEKVNFVDSFLLN